MIGASMWGEPLIAPSRPRGFRLLLSAALALVLGLGGAPAGQPVAAADGWDFGAERDALLGPLPADPSAAATALVDHIYGDSFNAATIATMELFRRAGMPIVNLAGLVAALPDQRVLLHTPVTAELVPSLVQSVRAGDYYTIEELNQLLVDSELFAAPLDPAALTGALGLWGKLSDDPGARPPAPEAVTAGAAVRALGARRGQVYYSAAYLPEDPSSVTVDLLQVTLIFSHFAAESYVLVPPTGQSLIERILGVGVARAAGLGEDCKTALTFYEEMGKKSDLLEGLDQELYEFLMEALKEATDDAGIPTEIPKPSDLLGISGKASAVMTTLLWLAGIRLNLQADPKKTHFRHSAGAGGEVTVTATASFKFPGLDQGLSQQGLDCLKLLTDVEAFPDGPLPGFKIRWSMDQPRAQSGQIQEGGKLLRPVASSEAAFYNTSGGGTTTGSDGTSKVVLQPAAERNPGSGNLNTGRATVTASLDKEDMPLKLKDLVGVVNPTKFAIDRLFDLANSAIRRIGLPKQQVPVTVEYHGGDIYTIEGKTTLFALWYFLPIKVALYTCDGLKGRWRGTSGFNADRNFFGDVANKLLPVIGINQQLPPNSNGQVQEDFQLDLTNGFDRALILLGFGLDVSVDARPSMGVNKTIEMTAGRGYVVGDAELTIQGQSAGPLAIFDGRSAIFDVKRYRPGDRPDLCPGSEVDSYFP